LVQGNTVSCIGNFKNIKLCRKIIEDCMQNIHPFIHIRNLTIKKKLLKSDELKNKSWSDFLPLELIKPKLITAKILKIDGKKIENREKKTVENHAGGCDFLKKCLETRKDFNFKFKTLNFK
jgi:rRNA processing protein Krr1/Pno1